MTSHLSETVPKVHLSKYFKYIGIFWFHKSNSFEHIGIFVLLSTLLSKTTLCYHPSLYVLFAFVRYEAADTEPTIVVKRIAFKPTRDLMEYEIILSYEN